MKLLLQPGCSGSEPVFFPLSAECPESGLTGE